MCLTFGLLTFLLTLLVFRALLLKRLEGVHCNGLVPWHNPLFATLEDDCNRLGRINVSLQPLQDLVMWHHAHDVEADPG